MMTLRLLVLFALLSSAVASAPAAPPVKLIFDTDMGNDVDDMLALGMIHAFISRGECELLAVTVTKDHPKAAALCDAVNRFYGRPDIPVGLTRSGITPDEGKFLKLASIRDGDQLRFPSRYETERAPDAVAVLRQVLAAQPNNSVVIVQVGFSTNLVQLMGSPGDEISPLAGGDLIHQKVTRLVVMAGQFAPDQSATEPFVEYNVAMDIPSAQKLAHAWPTLIDFSGFEIGQAIEYPSDSIARDFSYTPHHPLKEAYMLYEPPPHNRPCWDLTAVLQAVRPDQYFGFSPLGRVTISDRGVTRFDDLASRANHRFFKIRDDEQAARAREACRWLASEPPLKP